MYITFRPALLLLWAIAVTANAADPSVSASKDARPANILFILGDNWAYPHAGAYGDRSALTPAFDRIAQEGALFHHVYNASPSCAASRASILTGRAPHQLGEAGNLWGGFPKNLVTFTDVLTSRGYRVGYNGKGWAPGNYTLHGRTENPVGTRYRTLDEFLDSNGTAPFFFWLGNADTATSPGFTGWTYGKDMESVDLAGITVPAELPDVPEIRRDIQAYYAGVRKLDRSIAAAVTALEQRGLLDRTVIICTSDNGWQMPRGLANCYDAGSRVPMAMRWPGRIRPGIVINDLISLTDLTATILDIAAIPPPSDTNSRSLVDLIDGSVPPGGHRQAVFIERERHANVRSGNASFPMRAVRTQDFLYIWNLRAERWPAGDPVVHFDVGPFGDVDACKSKDFLLGALQENQFPELCSRIFLKRPAEELYDTKHDPRQMKNLAGDPAWSVIQADLRARLLRWMQETNDPRMDPLRDDWDHYPYYAPGVLPNDIAKEPMH